MRLVKKLSAKIDRINSKGQGVVLDKSNGSVTEIPFSLPDETIEYSHYEGKVGDINVKVCSPHRVKPNCPQFQKCGGCSLQHASESFVTDWKTSIVSKELADKGLYPKYFSTYVMPERSRRRAVFSGRRTKKGTIVGFKSYRSDQIVRTIGCIVIDKKILSFLPGMEEITALGCTRSSTIKIHVSVSENGLDVLVKSGKLLNRFLIGQLTKIAVQWNLARLSWNGELILSPKPPFQNYGRVKITPPEEFFMQATKEAEDIMVEAASKALKGQKNVVDLFCGSGTFSLPLSKGRNIIAFEKSSKMLNALDFASRHNSSFRAIRTRSRNLFKNPVSKDELSSVDGAVVNPPRAGARSQCRELAKSNVSKIILVSCNPTTFALDSEILVNGSYKLDSVRVIDQFRWSHHIEVLAIFSKVNK